MVLRVTFTFLLFPVEILSVIEKNGEGKPELVQARIARGTI